MPKPKYVAYYRVSTKQQGVSGLGLEAQQESIRHYLRNGGDLVSEFTDIESGRKVDRPELAKAIALCKRTGATLLIAKLDRLARNVHFISGLIQSRVDFIAVDNPHANKLTIQILAVVAEAEAEMISQRTKAALQAAKARGVKLGKPENLSEAARAKGRENARKNVIQSAKEDYAHLVPIVRQCKQDGLTFAAIADRLNDSGERTRRGSLFLSATVQRILKRS